jgi:hypothetical protein
VDSGAGKHLVSTPEYGFQLLAKLTDMRRFLGINWCPLFALQHDDGRDIYGVRMGNTKANLVVMIWR